MKRLLCCFLLITECCVAQVNLDKGLQAYYPFNGTGNDKSGNNNHPTFNNATITADRFGKPNSAYHFNGVYQYIRIPNKPSLNFTDQISLSVWVRPTGFYYDICHASQIISKGGGNYNPGNYALRFDDALYSMGSGCNGSVCDTLHQNFRGTGTVLKPYGGDFIKKDQWYHVLYTNDGKSAKLYVNCELKYIVLFPETFINNEDLFFGKSDDSFFPFWFNGDLDEVRIYNRALEADEIFALCQDTIENKKPAPDSLVKQPLLEKRTNEIMKEITVEHDSISVTLYDNGTVDGDSITLIFNGKILTEHSLLTEKPLTFKIKIVPGGGRNELQMYAENLGSIPPNTALMVIYDGDKRYEVSVKSSASSNGTVSFKLRE